MPSFHSVPGARQVVSDTGPGLPGDGASMHASPHASEQIPDFQKRQRIRDLT